MAADSKTGDARGPFGRWVLGWIDSNELPFLPPRWWIGTAREREIWYLRMVARRRMRRELIARQGWARTLTQAIAWPLWVLIKTTRHVRATRDSLYPSRSFWSAWLDAWLLQVGYNIRVSDQRDLCLDWPDKRIQVRLCMVCRELQALSALAHQKVHGREGIGRKVEFSQFCADAGIPTPALLTVGTVEGVSHRRTWPPRDLIFKPANLGKGKGVTLLCYNEGIWRDESGREVTPESLPDWVQEQVGAEDWVLQERFINSRSWQPFTTGALATSRVITVRTSSGAEPQVLAVYARFPIANTTVDNLAAGGIGASMDLKTGRMRRCTSRKGGVFEARTHPRTGARIEGELLPHAEELMALALRAHRAAGDWSSLGWDVAMTTQGPVLIEANLQWATPFHEAIGETLYPEVLQGVFGPRFEGLREALG